MLDKWEVPIYNDTYVMIFFGLLKKLVTRFMCTGDDDKVGNYVHTKVSKLTDFSVLVNMSCISLIWTLLIDVFTNIGQWWWWWWWLWR